MNKATLKVTRKQRETSIDDLRKTRAALVKVGVLTGMGLHPSSDSATFAEVAYFIEYGTENGTQEYAPFRKWLLAKRPEYKGLIESLIKDYILGKIPLRKVLSTLGITGQNDLRETMDEMESPANAPSTQERKGAKVGPGILVNNPTIDTGRLKQAISWGAV